MFFLVGFILSFAGFAMLVLGQFTLRGKRVVNSRASRMAGGIWLMVFPLLFLGRYLMVELEFEDTVEPMAIDSAIVGLCIVAGVWIVLRAVARSRPKRPVRTASRGPLPVEPAAASFESAPGPVPVEEPWTAPAPAKAAHPGRRPAPPEKNPFDFS